LGLPAIWLFYTTPDPATSSSPFKAHDTLADTQVVVRRRRAELALVGVTVMIAGIAPLPASAKQTPVARQTKAQAEVTLLRANKALLRLDRHLVDPRTHLVRTNTRVSCHGRGTSKRGMFLRFRCVIGNGNRRFLVSYVAFGQDGRVLRKIATLRPS
jgi:hypothetical protein